MNHVGHQDDVPQHQTEVVSQQWSKLSEFLGNVRRDSLDKQLASKPSDKIFSMSKSLKSRVKPRQVRNRTKGLENGQ